MTFPNSFTFISDEVSQDLPVLRAFVREFKLPGIELRSFSGRAFKDLTREDVAAIAAAAKEDGWKIFGCSTPVFKCEIDDPAGIQAHREIFKRSLEVAHTLNCDLLRVFTFLRHPNPLEPKRLDRVAEQLNGLVELAQGSGVRIGIENEHSCFVATIEEMEAVLSRIAAPSVGAIWDPCNVLYVPGAAVPHASDLARLGSRLFHLHVKDSVRRTPPNSSALIAVGMPIGTGEVDWRSHLRVLQAIGYKGMLSLETHWRLEKIDESMLHLPAGYGFSHGGETATRICFQTTKAVVDSI